MKKVIMIPVPVDVQNFEFKVKGVIGPIEDVAKTDTLPIIHITRTIEGEGLFVGIPRVFVRIAGCAVGCFGCDSPYSWNPKKFARYEIPELLDKILQEAENTSEISITGGEPLHYPRQVIQLCRLLQQSGKRVNLETSGIVLSDQIFKEFNYISLDIKTPSSRVHLTTDNIERLIKYAHSRHNLQLKAVITDQNDLDWLLENFYPLLNNNNYAANPIVLTPACNNVKRAVSLESLRAINDMILNWNKSYNIRIITQLHKLLDLP